MRYLYIIIFVLSLLPTYAAKPLYVRDSSIYVVRGNMQRLQDELIVSFELSVSRELSANESIVLEPKVIDSLGREMSLPKVYINSRKQQVMYQRGFYDDTDLSNSLRRKNGTKQSFHYLESLPYSSWMKSASLVVNEESCGCGLPISKDITFTAKITNSLPANLPLLASIMPEETGLKIREDRGSAFIIFPLNDTIIRADFKDNQAELDKITNSIDIIKNDTSCMVKRVTIHGYASPEGPYRVNEKLSRGRTNAVVKYVNDIYSFEQDDLLHAEHTAEDWLGFEALLEGSNYNYKSEILKIIHSNLTPDQKERKIRTKHPTFFKMLLDDWFIILRHTDYAIEYEVCFFNTIEEIELIYGSNPKNLSLNELFQLSQHYDNGSEEHNNVIMKSVMLFPDDPIANLNAAGVSLRRRNLTSARRNLDLSPECGERDLAQGVYYLLTEEYDKAEVYLNRAHQKGVKESLPYLQIFQSVAH